MNDKHHLLFQNEDGTTITRGQLEEIIASSVAKASEKKCRFPISDEQVMEAPHLFGMLKDIGDGDISKGIEECRQNHTYVKKIRAKSDKFSTYFFMIIIAALTGGVIKAIWEGVKSLIATKS